MADPEIGGRLPTVLTLEPGTYYWCTCGRSSNQPFCDGSHSGTEFSPQELVLTEPKRAALCTCKRTRKGPYCDGSHTKLP